MVIAVPMQVLVHMGGFSVNTCGKCLLHSGLTNVFRNGKEPPPYVFYCKLYSTIYVINMLKEVFFVFCVL